MSIPFAPKLAADRAIALDETQSIAWAVRAMLDAGWAVLSLEPRGIGETRRRFGSRGFVEQRQALVDEFLEIRSPGPLDDEEWKVMKEHPVISEYILQEVDLDPIAQA